MRGGKTLALFFVSCTSALLSEENRGNPAKAEIQAANACLLRGTAA
jgi:hypothetical protein